MFDVPFGYLFKPTDEELVSHYLYNKIHGFSLSIEGLIEEMDVYAHEPWLLLHKNSPFLRANEWYYFVNRQKVSDTSCSGKRPRRALEGDINGGWWKANGDKAIVLEDGTIIGYKNTLTFFSHNKKNGDRKDANKTDWIMHEYRLVSESFQERVLCRIRFKSKDIFDPCNAKPTASQNLNRLNGVDNSSVGLAYINFERMNQDSEANKHASKCNPYEFRALPCKSSAMHSDDSKGPETEHLPQLAAQPIPESGTQVEGEQEEEIGEIPWDEEYLNKNFFLSGDDGYEEKRFLG